MGSRPCGMRRKSENLPRRHVSIYISISLYFYIFVSLYHLYPTWILTEWSSASVEASADLERVRTTRVIAALFRNTSPSCKTNQRRLWKFGTEMLEFCENEKRANRCRRWTLASTSFANPRAGPARVTPVGDARVARERGMGLLSNGSVSARLAKIRRTHSGFALRKETHIPSEMTRTRRSRRRHAGVVGVDERFRVLLQQLVLAHRKPAISFFF